MTITGTCYFPTLHNAYLYYSHLRPEEVFEKVKSGEIYIRKPALKAGQRLFIRDNRYFIEEN